MSKKLTSLARVSLTAGSAGPHSTHSSPKLYIDKYVAIVQSIKWFVQLPFFAAIDSRALWIMYDVADSKVMRLIINFAVTKKYIKIYIKTSIYTNMRIINDILRFRYVRSAINCIKTHIFMVYICRAAHVRYVYNLLLQNLIKSTQCTQTQRSGQVAVKQRPWIKVFGNIFQKNPPRSPAYLALLNAVLFTQIPYGNSRESSGYNNWSIPNEFDFITNFSNKHKFLCRLIFY